MVASSVSSEVPVGVLVGGVDVGLPAAEGGDDEGKRGEADEGPRGKVADDAEEGHAHEDAVDHGSDRRHLAQLGGRRQRTVLLLLMSQRQRQQQRR